MLRTGCLAAPNGAPAAFKLNTSKKDFGCVLLCSIMLTLLHPLAVATFSTSLAGIDT